jgi:putative autotransporter adhesin-like protein
VTAAPAPVHRRRLRPPLWWAWPAGAALVGAVLALLFTADRTSDHLRGSGVPVEQKRTVPTFRSVELGGSTIVSVHVGAPRSVTVRGDDNLVSRITTTVRSGRLVIDTAGSFSTRTPMHVAVTVPLLRGLRLTGSGIVSVDDVHARSLTVMLSGSGVINAAGTAERLNVLLGGSGVAQLRGLTTRDAHAVVTGSGRIDLTATNALDASIPGSGVISYGGDPAHVTTRVSGSGAITPR